MRFFCSSVVFLFSRVSCHALASQPEGGGEQGQADLAAHTHAHKHESMVRQRLTLSLIALHCAAGYKTGKVVSCNA